MFEPKTIETLVSSAWPKLGLNKNREISRLVYEIAKRENTLAPGVIAGLEEHQFEKLKDILLARRYPAAFASHPRDDYYLPRLGLGQAGPVRVEGRRPEPERIFVERSCRNSALAERAARRHPSARLEVIPSMKEYCRGRVFTVNDYNQRQKNLFIVSEQYDFYKPCPCTSAARCCGYHLLNLGFGCGFECTYCFLQGYQNAPGIILPANIEDYFRNFVPPAAGSSLFDQPRVGSGEFTDSLIFDDLTAFSPLIVEFFRARPGVSFEFKTKSANVGNLLAAPSAPNVVVSWSVNPQKMIDENEFYTASIDERLAAARECADAGYGVAFHFDPVIRYTIWRDGYAEVIERIFDAVPARAVRWISIGTLRMKADIKRVIEARFPDNGILDAELLLGPDRKLRYAEHERVEVYRHLINRIRARSAATTVYLCMESPDVWRASGV